MIELGLGHRKTVLLIYAASIFMIALSTSIHERPGVVLIITALVALVISQIPGALVMIKNRREKDKLRIAVAISIAFIWMGILQSQTTFVPFGLALFMEC